MIILDIENILSIGNYEIDFKDNFNEKEIYILKCTSGSYQGYNRDIPIDSLNTFNKDSMVIIADNEDKVYELFEQNKEYILEQLLKDVKERLNNFKEEKNKYGV